MNSATEFTIEEMWLLQSVIRHEMQNGEGWKFPPASLELNDQIARALLMCSEQGLQSAFLELSRGDCLAIDYLVPNTAKSANGTMIGKSVLLKSYKARAQTSDWFVATAEEPEPVQLQDKLAEWKTTDQRVHTKYRKRKE